MADNARKTALTTTQKGDGGISPPVFNSTYGKTFGVWPRKERGPGFRRVPGTPGRTPFNGTAIEAPRTPRDDRLQVPAALFRDVHPPASRRWSSRTRKKCDAAGTGARTKGVKAATPSDRKTTNWFGGVPSGNPPPLPIFPRHVRRQSGREGFALATPGSNCWCGSHGGRLAGKPYCLDQQQAQHSSTHGVAQRSNSTKTINDEEVVREMMP